MAQHFLKSAAARSLKLADVMRMTDEQAREAFQLIRWADTDGEPVCPVCGCVESYYLATQRRWKCKGCSKQFSLTSGTIFHSRKMEVRNILAAIALFSNGVKGHAALHLVRDLGYAYQTAFVLLHKIREALGLAIDNSALSGVVEIDGMYTGGYSKPENEKKNRKDRRIVENQTGKRQVVVAMRERKGRTRAYVVKSEAQGAVLATQHIEPGTTIHADESRAWDRLSAHYPIKRIDHSQAYSLNGACTNAAESFFSRVRRAEHGIHHHISGPHLQAYATELAWREDFRRISNGAQFSMLADATAHAPKSVKWCGYWQRRVD
ncbi:MAG: IS1595 family transposase [Alphaproteobacteria bacterium]|nr:IS1595 family transposase [Alphaproteobacteria bacterium]